MTERSHESGAGASQHESDPQDPSTEPVPTRRAAAWRSVLLLAGVLLAAELVLFHPFLGADPTHSIAIFDPPQGRSASYDTLMLRDHAFVLRTLARNAWTLSERPWRIFDSETCFPAERALALGEPLISHGLIAAPIWIATGDAVLLLNVVQALLPVLAALAMFLLVRHWTGSWPGALAAGLLYGFSAVHNADMLHFYIHDMSFTVLAIYCTDRWLDEGRWRFAIGLAAAVALQIGSSLYPLVAATILAPPLLGWMIHRHGVRKTGWAQWAFIAVVVVATGLFVFLPYLDVPSDRKAAGDVFYMPWSAVMPSGKLFAGWSAWLLLICGAALTPIYGMRGGTPARGERAVGPLLLLLALGVLYVAAGGNAGDQLLRLSRGEPPPIGLPNPFSALRAAIPGFDLVRSPASIAVGAHRLVSLLVGLGVAALLRPMSGRARQALACLIVGLVFIESVAPTWLGLRPRLVVKAREIRPEEDSLAVYETLARSGPGGPIFETPRRKSAVTEAYSVLHAAFHRERTSGCAASFLQAGSDEMRELQSQLPAPEAVRRLSEIGFESITVHHPRGLEHSLYARRLGARLSRQASPTLELVATSRTVTAYAIVLEHDTERAGSTPGRRAPGAVAEVE